VTTLIEVRGGDGELIGRCDARCYEATTPDCDCVCGGMNHGAGRSRAIENTRAYAEAMIAEYAACHGLQDYTATVPDDVRQLELPL